jgi:hypothetical protein
MKSKVISVLILSVLFLSITLILVSCTYVGSPTQNTSYLETLRLSKPKPNREDITFIGDLAGSQIVEDCCPNAGPFPEYTMTLSEVFPMPMPGTHDGNIFMNVFMLMNERGRGKKKAYIVQFWWTDGSDYFIEIIGGDIESNKKTKILTVTFDMVPCEIWIDGQYSSEVTVNFILIRKEL